VTKTNLRSLVLAAIAAAAFSSAASASSITYTTPVGATTSGPVSASAAFTTGLGTITVTLTNLEGNPTDIAQNISDLLFTVSNDPTPTATISSSSGREISIDKDGNATTGSLVATGWGVEIDGGQIHLNDLGFAGPEHTIVGPGPYTNANGSIAGNNPHNPFIDQTATFVLNVPSVTADSTITGAIFSFGTIEGINVTGICTSGCTPQPPPVPEPASLVLFGSGLALLGTRLRRKKA
jgi:hypothetical protein